MISDIQRIKEVLHDGFSKVFSRDEIESLGTVARITIEVSDYLIKGRYVVPAANDIRYNLDTVISGVDSFVISVRAFNSLEDVVDSQVNWDKISQGTLLVAINDTYQKLLSEVDLKILVRHLLDLFKLQLAFVAAFY